jgi:hypothetical protein
VIQRVFPEEAANEWHHHHQEEPEHTYTSTVVLLAHMPILDNSVKHYGSREASSIGTNLQGPANPGADMNAAMSVDARRRGWALTPSAMAVDAGEHGWALLQTAPPLPHVGAPQGTDPNGCATTQSAMDMDAGDSRALKPIGSHELGPHE